MVCHMQDVCSFVFEKDPSLTTIIIHAYKDSSVLGVAKKLTMVHQLVEPVYQTSFQLLVELFNSQMGRYMLKPEIFEYLEYDVALVGLPFKDGCCATISFDMVLSVYAH